MILEKVFSPKTVILDLESSEKDELFEEMVESIVAVQPGLNREKALAALRERESKMSTGIMHAIAAPHGNCDSVTEAVGAIGISRKGVEYDSLDRAPVNVVFLILCNPGQPEAHLSVLKELATVLQNPNFVKEVMGKSTQQEVYDLICSYKESAQL